MRDIAGYEGLYAIDELGVVYSLQHDAHRRRRALKTHDNGYGYLRVNLYKNGKAQHKYVHRLVAEAFLGLPEKCQDVNHINANTHDNRLENLEWCARSDNLAHARSIGHWPKKLSVVATNQETKEVRKYHFLKDAASDLFGKYYALTYLYKTRGPVFDKGPWHFEVTPNEFRSA